MATNDLPKTHKALVLESTTIPPTVQTVPTPQPGPGSIVVRGHTDARPYKGTGYDNWRLSSARAQMAYYMLVRGGLDEKRVERIEGYADRRLKTPDKPEGAENRRIEILLRKEKP